MTRNTEGLNALGEALPKISHPLAYMVPIHEQYIGGKLDLTVSARELHAFFDIRTRFNTWIKERIADLGMEKEADYVKTTGVYGCFEYFFTLNTAIGVIQGQKGDKASCIRNYLIACEEPLVVATNGEHDHAEPNRDYHALLRYALKNYSAHLSKKTNEERPQVKPHQNSRKDSHALMCDALKEQRIRLGKKTEEGHYDREADMLNWLVLGMDGTSWLATRGLQGEIRHHLGTHQLELLAYLERCNTTLLDIDMAYPKRQEHLVVMLMRHMLRGIR
ncbi:antA/AntB antirepressor family protein [Aeromonas caviae]|uniref:antA/AntB antirepressor family protein n=1 Tax=Aeromonas caviae TaxID=648 RepID=UPI002B23FA8F|nr:antA/AntB antirepressor family protein [Aeromonas caviae]MEA9428254.1 antA/AntB antirepressor family protein [Aeromonas caviae]MEA9433643.1 antA/AntB antirepressor family protein [Aeromonas caviae]